MAASKFNNLRHVCFRHFIGEHAADAHAMAMDMQHHLDRVLAAFGKEFFQTTFSILRRAMPETSLLRIAKIVTGLGLLTATTSADDQGVFRCSLA